MPFRLSEAYVQFSERGLEKTEGATKKLRDRFRESIPLADKLKTLIAGFGAFYVVRGLFNVTAQMEQLGISIRVLSGDARIAVKLLADINKFAAKTPFEQLELGQAAKTLMAFRVEHEALIPLMRRLGDIAALSGAPLQDLVNIYGKLKSKGRLTMEEMNQLAERGVASMQDFAEVLGIPLEELPKRIEKGTIKFAEFETVLNSLTDAGGRFAGGMEESSKSIGGLWSTVTGNFKLAAAELGAAIAKATDLKNVLAGLGNALSKIASVINTPVVNAMLRFTTVIAGAAGITWAITKVISLVRLLVVALRSLATSLATVHGLSGPKGWLILAGGVAASIAAIESVKAAWDSVETSIDNSTEAVKRFNKETEDITIKQAEVLVKVYGAQVREARKALASAKQKGRTAPTEEARERFRGIAETIQIRLEESTRKLAESRARLGQEGVGAGGIVQGARGFVAGIPAGARGIAAGFGGAAGVTGAIREGIKEALGAVAGLKFKEQPLAGWQFERMIRERGRVPGTIGGRPRDELGLGRPGDRGGGVAGIFGLAGLASQMQQAAINRIQERQLAAQERMAAGIEAMQKALEKGRSPATGTLPVQMGGVGAMVIGQPGRIDN